MIHAKMLAALLQLLVVVLTAAAEDDCPGVRRLPFSSLSPSKFKKEHMDAKQPAIITGGLKRWPGAWRNASSAIAALLGSKGATSNAMGVFTRPYSSLRKGGAIHTVPLEAVVHNDTLDLAYGLNHELYIFSNILKDLNDVDALGDLTRSKTTRHLPYHQHGQDWVVGIGVEGGGAGFHSHGDAWLALLPMATPDQDAAKVWYWYRHDKHLPAEVFRQLHRLDLSDSDITAARHDVESASTAVTRCVQRPGDILYLPRSFPHSTRNVGEGILVSIGAQFGRTNDGRHLGSTHNDGPGIANGCDTGPMCEVKNFFQALLKIQTGGKRDQAVEATTPPSSSPPNKAATVPPTLIESLRRILALQPFALLEDSSASLYHTLARGGHADEAQLVIDAMLRAGRDDGDGACPHLRASALIFAADALIAKGELTRARQVLREAAALSPVSLGALERLRTTAFGPLEGESWAEAARWAQEHAAALVKSPEAHELAAAYAQRAQAEQRAPPVLDERGGGESSGRPQVAAKRQPKKKPKSRGRAKTKTEL